MKSMPGRSVLHAAVLGASLALGLAGIEVCTDADGSSTAEGNAMPATQSNSLFQVNVAEKKADLEWEDHPSPGQQKDGSHILTQEFGLTEGGSTEDQEEDETKETPEGGEEELGWDEDEKGEFEEEQGISNYHQCVMDHCVGGCSSGDTSCQKYCFTRYGCDVSALKGLCGCDALMADYKTPDSWPAGREAVARCKKYCRSDNLPVIRLAKRALDSCWGKNTLPDCVEKLSNGEIKAPTPAPTPSPPPQALTRRRRRRHQHLSRRRRRNEYY